MVSSLETEEPISVNRCYFEINPENIESLQLHAFGDGSEMAYAGVIYLRTETNKTVSTQLIMSKTRVALGARVSASLGVTGIFDFLQTCHSCEKCTVTSCKH